MIGRRDAECCVDMHVRVIQEDDRDRTTLSPEYRRCPTLDEQERQLARQARQQRPRRRRARP